MGKRHSDALAIQLGAVNPSAIAISIVAACKEIREEPDHTGTAQITDDPAIRLMVHQLSFICGLGSRFEPSGMTYHDATVACEKAVQTPALFQLGGELAKAMTENPELAQAVHDRARRNLAHIAAEHENPFHPESPEGRAWEDGDRSSIEPYAKDVNHD